jgi:cytochrome c biogenesis protein CcmG/thiol:disulfide interchange protein DsbE
MEDRNAAPIDPSGNHAPDAPPGATLAEEQPDAHGRVGYGRFGKWTPLLLAALILAVLGAIWAADRARQPNAAELERQTGNVTGEMAPDVTLTLLDGRPLRLADLRGKVVVLNFWASWCLPCREESPILEAFSRDATDAVVVGVGIRTDDDGDARAFVQEYGLTYPIGRDTDTDQPGVGPIQVAFGLPEAYPATVFIAPDGRVSRYHLGPVSAAQLAYGVEEARAS